MNRAVVILFGRSDTYADRTTEPPAGFVDVHRVFPDLRQPGNSSPRYVRDATWRKADYRADWRIEFPEDR